MYVFSMTAAMKVGEALYYAYQNSDAVGRAIVLFLTIGMSALTWTTMLDKALALSKAKRLSERFLFRFRENTRHIASSSLVRDADGNPSPIAQVYNAGVEKLIEFYENAQGGNALSGAVVPVKLSEAQFNAIEAVIEREVSSQIEQLETRIGLLATLVSLSPFCGLFGTVWGVMMAFCGIAVAGKADFTALAPGVAGALLTTVAGLVVAIPSLIGYNYLNGMIRSQTVQMDNFTEEFMAKIKLEQLAIDRREREN